MTKGINHTKHEFACAMLYFELPDIAYIHALIDDNDVYIGEDDTFGLEGNPHVSLLMGLHGCVSGEAVVATIQEYYIPEVCIGNVSTFPSRDDCDFEILKFDVQCDILYLINEKLREVYPYTTPFSYHPHCTIAYLKKGAAVKYVELLKNITYNAVPSKVVYSYQMTVIDVPIIYKQEVLLK